VLVASVLSVAGQQLAVGDGRWAICAGFPYTGTAQPTPASRVSSYQPLADRLACLAMVCLCCPHRCRFTAAAAQDMHSFTVLTLHASCATPDCSLFGLARSGPGQQDWLAMRDSRVASGCPAHRSGSTPEDEPGVGLLQRRRGSHTQGRSNPNSQVW
jgi:hypothetical protein